MSDAAFQAAMARLVIDGDWAAAVADVGDTALPPDLTPLEERRLVAVARDPGLRITRTVHSG